MALLQNGTSTNATSMRKFAPCLIRGSTQMVKKYRFYLGVS